MTRQSEEMTTGQLISQLSEQVSRLVKDEMRLARLEMQEKGKRAGLGAGMAGGAGVLALYGGLALVAAVILLLALVLPAWVSALIVGVVLLLVAGGLAMAAKKQVQRAVPPTPDETMRNVKTDIDVVKQRARR
ncbi:phage holin family protein [Bailinhaonella thermotolerans]|uniref:Phage holin family protein n=1 Tax=Bailinhaonella thermotolerans TaxID=1070861 RepID=A0A3A4BNP9_9ACTN|nr:phage holin family protein [Bailinhaonella thermotolerans]RJL32674.1 phage holin family protein [Bailinhaonella thermotolerans]